MNEHTLPDDFSRWPNNPFELLGVRPGVGERDLRRAYARLIRLFKPEQFPEHFRRIREAYEAARHYAQFFTPREAPEDPPAAQPVPATPDAGNASTPAAERPMPLSRSVEEELDEAWDWAIDGDEARTYARLLHLQDRYPGRADICIRLYSLLSIVPELDTRRTACAFLVQGLRQTGGSGPCHELYRREIESNPAEALTERFGELLTRTTRPELLATFVQWRWSAAGRQERFEVIGDDLPGLRARLAIDQEEIWLRLLTSAADQLAWAPAPITPVGLSECLQETAQHEHLQLRCADVFDRLESLERVAAGWQILRKQGKVPRALLELLSHYWTRPFSEVRRSVTPLLAALASEADRWLAYLDRINEASPQLLSLFGDILAAYPWAFNLDADGREPEKLAALARRFLEEHSDLGYSALRPWLLTFCLRELIDPDVIAQVALAQTVGLPGERLDRIVNDWPLRHVYRACTLLWS